MSTSTADRQPVSRPLLIVLGVAVLAALGYALFATVRPPDRQPAAAVPSSPATARARVQKSEPAPSPDLSIGPQLAFGLEVEAPPEVVALIATSAVPLEVVCVAPQ